MAKLPIPSAPMLVVGDIMCDHYVWGSVERISPEAPVQVLRWEREADKPGGAANAAFNLAALGCRVRLAGVIGNDDAGRWLLGTLKRAGIDTKAVIRSNERPTTMKTRVIARGQHMLRIDRETRAALSSHDERLASSARTMTRACSRRRSFVLLLRVRESPLSPSIRKAVIFGNTAAQIC
jgi:D-beta-D-heptose 7-phosphate kinase/D-beta-D-heptose 1-phosphate adenosyltransferase